MRYHRVDVHLNVATIKIFRATSPLRLPYMYPKLRAEKAIFQLFGPFFLDSRATRQRAENRLIKNHQNTEFLKFMRASVVHYSCTTPPCLLDSFIHSFLPRRREHKTQVSKLGLKTRPHVLNYGETPNMSLSIPKVAKPISASSRQTRS